MLTTEATSARPEPAGYPVTHCRHCAAGWTRTLKDGGMITVCLLDREPVPAAMTNCDRYEPKALPADPGPAATAETPI